MQGLRKSLGKPRSDRKLGLRVHWLIPLGLALTAFGGFPVHQADLRIRTSIRPYSTTGSYITFSFTSSNGGPDAAENVKITITLPDVVDFGIFSPPCAPPADGLIVCSYSLAVLEPHDQKFFPDIRFHYGGTGPITARASIESSSADPDPSDNFTEGTTKFVDGNFNGLDLVLKPEDPPERVSLGSTAEYRFRVVQEGFVTAQRVELTNRLPEQLHFESSTTGCYLSTSTVRCPLGSLGPGQEVAVEYKVRAVSLGGALSYAIVSAEIADGYSPDNTVANRTVVVAPNREPLLETEPTLAALSGETVELRASADDPDDDPVQFAWVQLDGPTVTVSNADSAAATFSAPFVEETTLFRFLVQANDRQATVEQQVDVAVSPVVAYFPQLGNGSTTELGFQTEFSLANTGAEGEFLLEFFAPGGQPLQLELDNGGSGDSLGTTLAPGASVNYRSSGTGPLSVGYARLKSTVGIGAAEVFARSNAANVVVYETGVPASAPLSQFTLLVDTSDDRDTGVALLNPPCPGEPGECEEAHLQLRLYDSASQLVASAESVLEPGVQISQFAREFFPDQTIPTATLRGVLTVVSDRPVVAVSLRQNHPGGRLPESVPTLFALPVLPGVAETGSQ